jgi:hypothetical protein
VIFFPPEVDLARGSVFWEEMGGLERTDPGGHAGLHPAVPAPVGHPVETTVDWDVESEAVLPEWGRGTPQ